MVRATQSGCTHSFLGSGNVLEGSRMEIVFNLGKALRLSGVAWLLLLIKGSHSLSWWMKLLLFSSSRVGKRRPPGGLNEPKRNKLGGGKAS